MIDPPPESDLLTGLPFLKSLGGIFHQVDQHLVDLPLIQFNHWHAIIFLHEKLNAQLLQVLRHQVLNPFQYISASNMPLMGIKLWFRCF